MSAKQMHIDPFERNWIVFSVIMLVLFATAVAVAAFGMGIQVPSPETRVDPKTVASDPNSPWANPGVREVVAGKKYDVYILAKTWQYLPAEVKVPVGAKVTFYVTSMDVQHGFKLQDTNVNFQIVPGQVSKLTTTFTKPGSYNYICTEYCGAAHAAMYGVVIVEP
ncbi:MAG: cytochrome c oxidase subunit II [Anaerolineales bacterium]|nr:cytochrome c oxidase subunit II [Anaerolineales bacterium]